jgi:hypothetical protein
VLPGVPLPHPPVPGASSEPKLLDKHGHNPFHRHHDDAATAPSPDSAAPPTPEPTVDPATEMLAVARAAAARRQAEQARMDEQVAAQLDPPIAPVPATAGPAGGYPGPAPTSPAPVTSITPVAEDVAARTTDDATAGTSPRELDAQEAPMTDTERATPTVDPEAPAPHSHARPADAPAPEPDPDVPAITHSKKGSHASKGGSSRTMVLLLVLLVVLALAAVAAFVWPGFALTSD